MRCPACNQEIPDTAKFCGYCGHRLPEVVSPPPTPEPAPEPVVTPPPPAPEPEPVVTPPPPEPEPEPLVTPPPPEPEPEPEPAPVVTPPPPEPEPTVTPPPAPEPEPEPGPMVTPAPEHEGGIPVWVWGVAALLAVAVIAWFAFLGPRQPPQPVEEVAAPTRQPSQPVEEEVAAPTRPPSSGGGGEALTDTSQPCKYASAGEEIQSQWRLKSVAFDGKITKADEWADAACFNATLGDAPWLDEADKTGIEIASKWWVKNNDQRVFFLVRVSASEFDADFAGADYFESEGDSDAGGVAQDGATYDDYGWDGSQWVDDEEASPPGDMNVQGAASQYGGYYWFEFAKDLDSGDGYDWSWAPGDTIGDDGAFLLIIDGPDVGDWGELELRLHLADGP